MRLGPEHVSVIRETIAREISPEARVWLFGSRVDDARRGGDVDLYVEADSPPLLRQLQCKIDLEEALDLHVDLIVARSGAPRPIGEIAKTEGLLL
jgi:predicted nucleotidyltransferase